MNVWRGILTLLLQLLLLNVNFAKATAMAAVGWAVSALMSVPQLGVYGVNVVANKTVCESIFRLRPISHRQAYLTFINVVVFFVPLIIMFICYVRIFTKISSKANQTTSVLSTDEPQPGDIALTSMTVRNIFKRFISQESDSDTSAARPCTANLAPRPVAGCNQLTN